MKKNKFIIVYSIIASLTIVFALSYLGYNLYSEYQHGYERSKRRFDHLTTSIQKLSEKQFNSKREYNIEIEKTIGDTSDFAYLEIKENGNTVYIYPDAEAKSDISSNLIKNYYDYFKVENSNIYISGDLYILRPASIYYYSKIAFLIILIVTLLTLIFVIYYNVHDPDATSKADEIEGDFVNSPKSEENVFEAAFNKADSEASADDDEELDMDSEITQTFNTHDHFLSASLKEEEKVEKTEEEPAEKEETTDEPEEKVDLPYKEFEPAKITTLSGEVLEPSGLFSPDTGLGWESYLMTRLDNELNRAIGSEFDLALFIFQIPGLLRTSPKIKAVCEYLIAQFQYKDLLFEYKNDCIVAIKVNMNLDSALTLADKLYVDIKNIIGAGDNCYIGISTRTIRMVAGERLLKEAEEALVHAHENAEDPIIAFRANAEKYRQFLEKNA